VQRLLLRRQWLRGHGQHWGHGVPTGMDWLRGLIEEARTNCNAYVPAGAAMWEMDWAL
jgi:hypothetical protein